MKVLTNLLLILMIVFGVIAVIFTFISLGASHPAPWIITAIVILIPILYSKYSASKYIQWNDKYSVNIQLIDDDHKRLIHLINQLQSSIDYYQSQSFDEEALKELIDYTKFHFKREEDLMQEYDYPGYEEHIVQHKKMIEKINNMVEKYSKSGESTISETVDFLRDWLINHIQKTDQQYVPFFKEKGVS